MNTINTIKSDLSSENNATVEGALNSLTKYVIENSSDEHNPLAEYFDQSPSYDELVELPLLDNAFERVKTNIDSGTIVDVIKMSFQDVGRDNYKIIILSIKEVLKRKDRKAQKKVINHFEHLLEDYDYGHRFWVDTVLDEIKLATIKAWADIKMICRTLFRVMESQQIVHDLHIAVIASIKTSDADAFKEFEKYIPEHTDHRILVYNLACAYAKFSEKANMLAYVGRAIELGKS